MRFLPLKLNGDHNFLNAACVISISLALGIDIDFIKKRLNHSSQFHLD